VVVTENLTPRYDEPVKEEAAEDKIKVEVPDVTETDFISDWNKINRYAVIIGVSDYKNPDIPDLSYAHKDAIDLYEFLASPKGGDFKKSNMKLLLNDNATTQNIRDALFNFLKRAKKEDIVYIYFSGHGAPENINPDNMYLITHDTDLQKVSSTAFPMWDIQTALARHIQSERVIIITDACHSGQVGEEIKTKSLKKQNLINRYLMELSKSKSGRACLTASESGELSAESQGWGGGHGVFTYFLLEALKGKADKDRNGIVSVKEVINYTFEKVVMETKGRQHPDYAGNFDGDLPMSVIKK
ncbi:caspase domain-containing protein, partial [candidate division KSB1 bacterium]